MQTGKQKEQPQDCSLFAYINSSSIQLCKRVKAMNCLTLTSDHANRDSHQQDREDLLNRWNG